MLFLKIEMKKSMKIKEIDEKIKKYEKYVKEHPERLGMKGNIKTLKYVKEVLSENDGKE